MAPAKPIKSKTYRVRESARAKHVSIKISHLGEVEVVVPFGFDRQQIPEIVQKRQDWIAKTTQRIVAERQAAPLSQTAGQLPEIISLQSLPERWQLRYEQTAANHVVASKTGAQRLLVRGAIHHPQLCQRVLKQWLKRKAEMHLIPWLRRTSQEVNLPFNQVAIRGQKTLWASCSAKTNISLNYKLLFLPPRLVRYVFIHELCHTVHLNHSDRFWGLVAEKEPIYDRLDAELNKAWIYIPDWVEQGFAEESGAGLD
ncbi:MAG: M48 family metallopeptidase [Elainella sp.]